ncbi:hypothetical protein CVS40_11048 [Lucilia cuprina]|nr:hypothetical protein CVS40_11048 [Lucilia cuprina]
MLLEDLCLKIYFWPFLSYLAALKGLCPFYPHGFFPIITLPPDAGSTSTSPIPTYQPTPPTTLPPCPADPLVCLPGGERPISYCPCIDPRQQNGQTTTTADMTSAETEFMNLENLQLRLAPTYPTAVMGSEMMIFSHLDNDAKKRKRRKRKKREVTKEKEKNLIV